MSNKDPILELRGASKSFGAVQALYQVDFHVAPGEVMALVGDNGAGKSTLIKSIAGIHTIDEGDVVFDDGFLKKSDVCTGKFAQFCTDAGL